MNKTTKTKATTKTPKTTRRATPSDTPQAKAALIDEATLLRAALLLPELDRYAIMVAGKLMDMAKTEAPGRIVRQLAKELRATPALRDDAATMGMILRGVAEAFDRAGKGAK